MRKHNIQTSQDRNPKKLSSLFWDYEFDSLRNNLSSHFIIARLLEMVTPEEFEIFASIVGDDKIVEFLDQKGEKMLSKQAFNYWKLYYEKKAQKAHREAILFVRS